MLVTLYRGMNKEEFELWNSNRDLLNNVSWWSDNETTAKTYAVYAVAKCSILLKEEELVKFVNSARGDTPDYCGYGRHSEIKSFYSMSKKYLLENSLDITFETGTKILEMEFLSESEISMKLKERNIFGVFFHMYDKEKSQKITPLKYETCTEETLREYLKSYKIAKTNNDVINLVEIIDI